MTKGPKTMIKELCFKRSLKRRQFCVPEADIWSGEYRRIFEAAFFHYKEVDEWRVEEFTLGLIVQLPRDCQEFLPCDIPLLELNTSKADTKIKEVFALCQSP